MNNNEIIKTGVINMLMVKSLLSDYYSSEMDIESEDFNILNPKSIVAESYEIEDGIYAISGTAIMSRNGIEFEEIITAEYHVRTKLCKIFTSDDNDELRLIKEFDPIEVLISEKTYDIFVNHNQKINDVTQKIKDMKDDEFPF